jgi:beta-N-acetylhexosaminidase
MQLSDFNKVIISYHKADGAWKKHDFSAEEIRWITEIAKRKKVILLFVKPYALSAFPSFEDLDGVIVAYQNNEIAQKVSGSIDFWFNSSERKITGFINEEFKVNHGDYLQKK